MNLKHPKIKVISQTRGDKKKAKLMEEFLNYQYQENKEFVDAIARAKTYIKAVYGIETKEQPWEMIMLAYFKVTMKNKMEDK